MQNVSFCHYFSQQGHAWANEPTASFGPLSKITEYENKAIVVYGKLQNFENLYDMIGGKELTRLGKPRNNSSPKYLVNYAFPIE